MLKFAKNRNEMYFRTSIEYSESHENEFIAKYQQYGRDIALRIYTSRLIGAQSRMVLHGGGNTSVKLKCVDKVGLFHKYLD